MTSGAAKILAEISSSSVVYSPAKDAFRRLGLEVDFHVSKTKEERLNKVRDYEIIAPGAEMFGKELMDSAKKLRMIQVWGIGLDKVDVKEAAKKRITVCNTGGVIAEAVAEHAWGLLFAATKRLTLIDSKMRKGEDLTKEGWWAPPPSIEFYGKAIGIVGFGNIGRRIARIARAFDMKMLVYDPIITDDIAEIHSVRFTSLDELLKESDFVCITIPLNEQTMGLIGEKELALMKSTAFLVNVSRGQTVRESALIQALENAKIAGAGLDVFENEPLPRDSVLRRMENVVMTPHKASNSEEAIMKLCQAVAENIKRFVEGEKPFWIVN